MTIKFTPATMHGSQVGMKKDLRFTPALPKGLASAGFSVRDGVKFTPAVIGMTDRGNIKKDKNYTLDWWTDTAIFRYDAMLVSAFYGMDKWDFREYYKIPRKNFTLIGDSGGFQIWTQGVKIEPLDILRWQEHNVDIALTVDVPPPSPCPDFTLFTRASDLSRKNYEIAYRSRESEDIELFKVLQGDNRKELNYWWDNVADLEFDGVSISVHPPTPMPLAINLGYIMDKGEKKTHVLLGTGKGTYPTAVYAKRFFDRITIDSASFSISGARNRGYWLPYDIGSAINFGKKFSGELKKLPCKCPVCQLATIDDLNSEGSLAGGLIALHNLWTSLSYYDFLDDISDDRELFLSYIKREGYDESVKAISFLDDVYEMGFDDAWEKLRPSVDVRTMFE